MSGLRRRVPEPIRLLLANPKSRFGIVLLLVIVVAVIAAPVLTSHLPTEPDSLPRQPPSFENPFGTTDQGYNVFAQVLYGGRTSLGVAAIASVIAMSIAITLGLLAAYSGGWVDDSIVLLTNVFLVIPILPPLTGFASFFASAVGGLILVEVVFSYPGVGLTLQQAALGHDYAVVQALLLVLAICVLVANFIMDCLYVVLDPRVRSA